MNARRQWRWVAGLILAGIAILHIGHPTYGLRGLFIYAQAGTPLIDPRPLAFTLSGLGILLGLIAVHLGVISLRRGYIAGCLVLGMYLLGYIAWHVTGHGGFWPGLEPRSHHGHPITVLIDHLAADHWERMTKFLELLGLLVLGYLVIKDEYLTGQ